MHVLALLALLALGCRVPMPAPDSGAEGDSTPGDSADTEPDTETDTETDTEPSGGDDSGADCTVIDGDGDGESACTDCDDTNPAISSYVAERCDGVDNNCDGRVDELGATGESDWHGDADEDGYGDDAVVVVACDAPSGYVAPGGDCDDADARYNPGAVESDCTDPSDYNCDGYVGYVNADGDAYSACEDCDDSSALNFPGASEYCDGEDNDCDGTADESSAMDAGIWYADFDSDGFGDPASRLASCTVASGYVSDDTDCDDGDGQVWPGAAELCDGVDHDCDGLVDEDASVDAVVWYQDADGDGYGSATGSTTACSEPAGHVGDATDCDDGNAAVNPGAMEVCDNELDDDCDGLAGVCDWGDTDLSAADAIFEGEARTDFAGISVAGAGDVNADGYDDMLIGAYGAAGSDPDSGAAYLVLGQSAPESLGLGSADAQYTGEATNDQAGVSVAGVGDVNADGYADLLVGAFFNDDAGSDAGAAYLILGGLAPASSSLGAADAEYASQSPYDYAGVHMSAAGDVDGDGFADLLIGASGSDAGGTSAGAAFLILGRATPVAAGLASADAEYTGSAPADYAGAWASGGGDVDGDGLDDILVGAYANDDAGTDAGAAYLILGLASPVSLTLSAADAVYSGAAAGDQAGSSAANDGDLNADGYSDVVVSATGNDDAGGDAGAAYLVLGGPMPASTSLSSADAEYTGEAISDFAGYPATHAGDLDADGFDDLLLGAQGNDDGGSYAGAVYLVLGGASPASVALSGAAAELQGEEAWDQAGFAASGAGDVNADGRVDLLVGAYQNSGAAYYAGAAYLMLGTSW